MNLYAEVVPPPHVLDEVMAAVQQACHQAQIAADERAAEGRRGRPGGGWFRRKREAESASPAHSSPSSVQLDLLAAEELAIPLARFGNVTRRDSLRLADVMRTAAAEIERPAVYFSGASALDFDGDRQVWVRLAGDVDAIRDVPRGVTQAVEKLGFYVDRRLFRTQIAVGTINDATTAPYLEDVVDALKSFSGVAWELDHVRVMRLSYDAGSQNQLLERLPLGC